MGMCFIHAYIFSLFFSPYSLSEELLYSQLLLRQYLVSSFQNTSKGEVYFPISLMLMWAV